MQKTMAQKVEEIHAALPEQFKRFVRHIAAVPKTEIEVYAKAARGPQKAK